MSFHSPQLPEYSLAEEIFRSIYAYWRICPAATVMAPPKPALLPAAFPFAVVFRFFSDFACTVRSPTNAMMLFAAFAFLAALAFVVVFTMFTATTGTTALPPAAPAMALASMAPLEDASMVRLPMVPLELLPFTRAVSPSSALVVWLTTLTAIAVPTPTRLC